MNYILFNADGSVNTQHLDYYIMQGSTGVNKIFVSIADTLITNTTIALFSLPNQTTSTQAGVYQADYEYAEGLTANGWLITLTSTETLYKGLLRMSVLVYTGTTLLLTTYPIALVVNETGYRPDADTGVTIEEINTYLQQLQSYALLADVEDRFLPLIGGTMSGAISQPVAPVDNTDLANKKYVDDSVKVATDDIADIIDGDLTVHTAYHAGMDVSGRNLVDLAKQSDLTDGTITVKKAETAQKDFSGNVITTYYQPKLVWDTTPTQSSTKPVTSGGIKTYVDKIAIDKGSFTSVASFMHSISPSYGGTYFANVVRSGYTYKYYAFVNFTLATIIGGNNIYKYEYMDNGWTELGIYRIGKELGSKLYLNTTDYKLYLRNYLDEDLSMVDLPLESVVVSGSYDEATQSIILTLQNGTEISIPVADLVDGLVPNTRTIAGVDLADDIPASELKTALSLVSADVGFDNTIKNLLTATNLQEAVDEVSEKVTDIEAVIPSVASPTNQLTARSEVVKIMTAPASTTLTDDEIAQFINGVYINGTFLGQTNPVFFPAIEGSTTYTGIFQANSLVGAYSINKTSKIIAVVAASGGAITLQSIYSFNGKVLPTNPSNTGQFDYTMVDGTLTWKERIYEYANMYLSNNATAVSLTADTLTKFAIPMTGGASSGITISTADDNLTILKTGVYQVIITFNTSVSVNDLELEIAVYKNTSTLIPELKNASTLDTSILQGIVSLTANDLLDVRVKADGDCDMTVINATISVRRIS